MERTNWTDIEFILQGLSEYPRAEKLLFAMCLLMYLVILLGNSTLIILTLLDSHLHTPMYFFLCNLSFLDIWYTSSFIPSMLIHFLSEKKTISFTRCVVQMSVSYTMGSTECVLLAVMAYDRSIAICNPLRYPSIMSKALCIQMAALSWGLGFLNSLTETILAVQLPFCGKKSHQSFCLWNIGFCQASLHRYILEWDYYHVGQCTIFICSITVDLYLLHFHPFHCPKNQFSRRKKKGFFHLLSPHNGGDCVLWDNPLHVYEAKVQRRCFWQIDCPVLWSRHTDAQSYHL